MIMAETQAKTAKIIQLGKRKASYKEQLIILHQELDLINHRLNANLNSINGNMDQGINRKYSFDWIKSLRSYISKKFS